ncbi:MAG: protein kinase domain-containing protein [Limisphaerales bacterium]
MNSEAKPKCPQCGTILPADAPEGLCPNCLLAVNLKTETVFSGDPPAAQPPLPPEEIAPHFPQLEILECLGRGGMGVVYKARQKTLNRFVALKLLAPERVSDAKFAERFAREAQALAALNHPNIVTVYDFGQAGGCYYLLMEFVDGVNLRHLLRARKFTPEEALAIVPPLCDALQFAHERGIVHRDIKPENILLDTSGRVKVADFGIAKMLGPGNGESGGETGLSSNVTQSAIGTPAYSAPEQKTDPRRVDSRADIYSLGVVFYEMLTGQLPDKNLEPPSHKVQIDVRLDEVVLRALEKKPELRYQQANEVKTQVETIAAGRTDLEEQNQKTEVGPRLCGTAIVGAGLAPLFFISMFFWDFGGLGGLLALRGVLISSLGFIAIIGTTILGWVSIGQIRRSEGRLEGMWLAMFDGLMLPVLLLDILILFVLLLANKLLNFYVLSAWYPSLKDSMVLNLPHFIVWLLVTTAAVVGSDYAIIRRVWRAVNAPPNGSRASGGTRWKAHVAVATIICLTFVSIALVAGYRHANKTDYIGRIYCPQGDFIKIYTVQRSKERMVVKGSYDLVSHDSATLALYITTTNSGAVPTGPQQEMGITNGWGNFELIDTHLAPGLPHVSMYADGHPFASLYFGTKAEAFQEHQATWITNASRASAATEVPSSQETAAGLESTNANGPKVIFVSPADGVSNVDPQQEIRIRFDQPMNPNDLAVQWLSGGFLPDGQPRYESGQNEFVIPVWLAPGQTNELLVNFGSGAFGGFHSTNSALAQTYRWHFITQPLAVKPGAAPPKVVSISPTPGETLPVLTLFQITFDQPMMPPGQSPPYLHTIGWGGGLPALIPSFDYDPASRTFAIPVLLPPDNETRLTLEGFRSADGVASEPVVISCQVGTNDYSSEQRYQIASVSKDPRLEQLLSSMKSARARLTSGVETVQSLMLFGQRESLDNEIISQFSMFKWQGTNQTYADISDVMGTTKAFILGTDGKTCWLYSEDEHGERRLDSAPTATVAETDTSIADPFDLTSLTAEQAIAQDRLVYLGRTQLDGRTCERVESWFVRQTQNEPSGVSASKSVWWIDAETFLPVQVIQCGTFGSEIFRFHYDNLNLPLPVATFQSPVEPGASLKSDDWFERKLGPEDKRFLTIKDGADGRMSGRLGVSGPEGTTSSGLN